MRIEERNGDLTVVDFDELEACKIACKIERDGMRFYRRLSEKVAFPEEREVLDFLVRKEREHLEFFEGELIRLRETVEDSFEEDNLLGDLDYGVFQPYQSMEELDKVLASRAKALRLGLAVEKKSIQFYETCRRYVTSGRAKDELALIIGEEEEHKRLLENMLKGEKKGGKAS